MITHDALAKIFKILLGVALNAHKIDGVFIVNKPADQRRFANTAATIYYYKLKPVSYTHIVRAHESINKLALVPESF